MKDVANKDINVGDKVLLNSKPSNSYGKNKLHFGTVTDFTKTKVRVKNNYTKKSTILKKPNELYIICNNYHGSDL